MSEERSRYTTHSIGRCDWCGVVSHHLVAGECPACAEKVEGAGVTRAVMGADGTCELFDTFDFEEPPKLVFTAARGLFLPLFPKPVEGLFQPLVPADNEGDR